MRSEIIINVLLHASSDQTVEILIKAIDQIRTTHHNELPVTIKTEEELKQLTEILDQNANQVTSDISISETFDALQTAYHQLAKIHDTQREQATKSFNYALTFVSMGTFIIFAGTILVYLGNITTGILALSAGAFSDVISGGFFVLYSQSNNRLDGTRSDLMNLIRAQQHLNTTQRIIAHEDTDDFAVPT